MGHAMSVPGERTFWAEGQMRAMGLRQNNDDGRILCYTMKSILGNSMASP